MDVTYMLQYNFQFMLREKKDEQADVTQHEDQDEYVSGQVAKLIKAGLQVNNFISIESKQYSTMTLHLARLQAGKVSIVFALLDDNSYAEAPANAKNAKDVVLMADAKDKDTAIHVVALSGNLSIMVALFSALLPATTDASVFPNWHNKWEHISLHYALAKGNVAIARYLIQKRADVSAIDLYGSMGIHFAARGGNVECLQLVTNSSNINTPNNTGLTALHYALWNNKADAVEWLLANKAKLGEVDSIKQGMPVHWVVMRGTVSIQQTLQALVKAYVRGYTYILKPNKYRKNVLEMAEKYQELGRGLVGTVLEAMDKAGLMEKKATLLAPTVKCVRRPRNE